MLPDNNLKLEQRNAEYTISSDNRGEPLEGGRRYLLRLVQDIPQCTYWSVIVYDSRTRLIIKNKQLWPSVHSNSHNLLVNPDGSVDVWFGPDIPSGNEHNWIKTNRKRGWYAIIRLYDLTDKLTVRDWAPGHIEPVQNK